MPKPTFHLATLNPEQLNRLAKAYRRGGLKEPPGEEKKRLFLQASRLQVLARIRSKREQNQEPTAGPSN